MKKLMYIILILLLGCSKGNGDGGQNTIEYQVVATNHTVLAVTYVNETKNTVSANIQSGWKYSFKSSEKPLTLYLRALGAIGDYRVTVTVTAKILVNGVIKIEKTDTGGGSAMAEIQYVLQ